MRSMLELTEVIKGEVLSDGHEGLIDADIEWFVGMFVIIQSGKINF
jgi:hypothetical protein